MQRFKPISWLPGSPRLSGGPAAQPSLKAQRVELQRIEAACATIGDPAADEADLRAAFLAIGSALCTEKQRYAALHQQVQGLESEIARLKSEVPA